MISRIKEIITYYSLSNRAFAIKCGLKDNTFINQLNGVREVSLNTINAILLSFEDISAEWLLRGKGQMLLSEVNNDAQNIERMKTIQLLTEDNKKVRGELAMLKNERNAG